MTLFCLAPRGAPLSLTLLTLASALTACGGGGGGGGGTAGTPTAPVSAPFAKYEGEWKGPCQSHLRETVTLVASNNATVLAISDKSDYFANADCSGGIVATGVYSQPIAKLSYAATEANASVKLQTGETVTGAVDRGTATATDATISFTGSGASSTVSGGKTTWHIAYNGGGLDIVIDTISGASPGGLLLRNGQLYILSPDGNSTTSFQASGALTR